MNIRGILSKYAQAKLAALNRFKIISVQLRRVLRRAELLKKVFVLRTLVAIHINPSNFLNN